MDMWFLLCVLVGIVSAYYYFYKDANLFKKHGILHISPLPIVGNMGPFFLRRKTSADIIQTIYNLNEDAKYVGFFDGVNSMLMIRDPELIKTISIKNFDIFCDRGNFFTEFNDSLIDKNLVALQGDEWRNVRSLLSPSFSSSKIKSMFILMTECAVNFTDFLCQMPLDKNTVEMKNYFTRYTNDVIASCAFGINIDSMKNPNNKFYVYGKEMTTFDTLRMLKLYFIRSMPCLTKLLGITIMRKCVGEFFKNIVRTTIDIRDKQNITRPDMLQLMMDSRGKRGPGKELTIENMTSQAFIFFFGGFDTVSNLMSFTAHEIAVNPEIQAKLRNEVDAVLRATNGQLTYEAINNMEYLGAVINEALRMWSVSIPFIERKCVQNFELPPALQGNKPFLVKKGMIVCFPLYSLHRDPKYFENPHVFCPERFLGENKQDIIPGTYIPFGLGPRSCIAYRFALIETKTVLFHLLARCELKPCDKTSQPLQLCKKSFSITADGFWLQIVPRKNSYIHMQKNGKDEHTYK